MTRTIVLDRSRHLRAVILALFVAGMLIALSGCSTNGAITGYDFDDTGGGGAGTSGGNVTAIAATDSSDPGSRGIVITFDQPVDDSSLDVTFTDEDGNDRQPNNKRRSEDGKTWTFYGAFPYCSVLAVTANGQTSNVTMGTNPYDFDGNGFCTADFSYGYVYEGQQSYDFMFTALGEMIDLSTDIPLDALVFYEARAIWGGVSRSDAIRLSGYILSDKLTNVDGEGGGGLSAYWNQGSQSGDYTAALIWTDYSLVREMDPLPPLPQSVFLGTRYGVQGVDGMICNIDGVQDIGNVDGHGVNEIAITETCSYSRNVHYHIVSILTGPLPAAPYDDPASVTSVNVVASEQEPIYVEANPWHSITSICRDVADVNGDGLGDMVAVLTDADLEDLGGGLPHGADTVYSSSVIVYPGMERVYRMLDAPAVTISMDARSLAQRRMFRTVNAADVNGDGISDIIATDGQASIANNGYTVINPKAYIFFGRSEWPSGLTQEDADVVISKLIPTAGLVVMAGGDLNADGYEDLLMTASYPSNLGSVLIRGYVFYGRESWRPLYSLEKDYDVRVVGNSDFTFGAFSGIPVGDIDNDGNDDIMFFVNNTVKDGSNYWLYLRGGALPSEITPADAYARIVASYTEPLPPN